MKDEPIYNPLDKKSLGENVSDALLRRPPERLPPAEQFRGAGIYVLYYTGGLPLYQEVAKANLKGKFGRPVYVGKAVPKGSRKGGFDLDGKSGTDLHDRLVEHAESIQQAKNLELDDFQCRYLVVDDIFIKLGESLLIQRFEPIWNQALDGFGNHDPGRGRYRQRRSPWDTIHPGRTWALKCPPNQRSVAEITKQVRTFIKERYRADTLSGSD